MPSHGLLGSGAVVALATGVALLFSAAGSAALVAVFAGVGVGLGGALWLARDRAQGAGHAAPARVQHPDRPRRRGPRATTPCSSTARCGALAAGASRATRRSTRGLPIVVENVNGLTLTVRPAEEWEVAP